MYHIKLIITYTFKCIYMIYLIKLHNYQIFFNEKFLYLFKKIFLNLFINVNNNNSSNITQLEGKPSWEEKNSSRKNSNIIQKLQSICIII